MASHSSIVGGSTADRLLNCPGSFQATRALPPSADKPSEYAEEGTAMHKVMDHLMRDRQASIGRSDLPYHRQLVDYFVGQMIFHDRLLTHEHVDSMIMPALEALNELETLYGGGFDVLAVEAPVAFPGIPGAFGTIDLVLGNDSHILHVDWKFGQGVGVRASYADEQGERLNPQMMFYTIAHRAGARHLYYRDRKMIIAIIQPRSEQPLTHTEITARDIRWFTQDLRNAVIAALDRDPPRVKGEHCRFAPCKIDCPLWTGPLIDLSSLGEVVQARTDTVSREPTPYGEYLARAKQLVDQMDLFKKTLDEQLHAYLEDGGLVPGWRLKQKVKKRQWIDEDTVWEELRELGFSHDKIFERKLKTFAAVDAVARHLGVKVPDHLRVAPPTTETTVCAVDDPAPVVERQLAIEQFKASLQQLLKTAPSPADDKATARQEAGK